MKKSAIRKKLAIRSETLQNLALVRGGFEESGETRSFISCPPNGLTCFRGCETTDTWHSCPPHCAGTGGTCDGCTLITF